MSPNMEKATFLWLLTQSDNRGYDTFDSCVVAARTKDLAVKISPATGSHGFGYHSRWAYSPESVHAELIGVCEKSREGQVIISSFNAG